MFDSSPTILESLVAIVLTSRPVAWCFGPILFGIGLIHSGSISKIIRNYTLLLTAVAQVITLSFPLCIGKHHYELLETREVEITLRQLFSG